LLDDLLADLRWALDPRDALGLDAHGPRDDLGHLDVEAGQLTVKTLEAEAGLVVLRADLDRAGGSDLGHRRVCLELGLVSHRRGAPTARATCTQGERGDCWACR